MHLVCAFTGHAIYAKYAKIYLQQMINLQKSHLHLHMHIKQFVHGNHTVHL
jgi:23S rRNA maturation mini-RNase III